MKHIFALALCLVFALTTCSVCAAADDLSAFGNLDFSRPLPSLSISKDSPEHTRISLESPVIQTLDVMVDYKPYRVYGLAGEPFDEMDGAPSIPQVTRLYRIPNTGAVDLRITQAEFEITENVDVFPQQSNSERFPTDFYKDPAIYDHDGWYPPEPVVMSAPMVFRDFRVVQVTLYPVQVNPRLHQTRVYSQLDAEVIAADGPGENELLNPRRPSGAFAPLYRAHIANLDESSLDEVSITPGSYLILCRNNTVALRWADSLATWKRRCGYKVVIDARASWSAGQMRTAIVNQYTAANPPLEFVCIMGDPGAGGNLSMPTDGSNYDHYFASLTTGDDIEDIGVGRIPASSDGDFNTILAKIYAYERTPYMTDTGWFDRAFLYAGRSSQISSNEITMLWAKRQLLRYTGIQTVNVATHDGGVNNQTIYTRLNEGVLIFLWRGTVVGEMSTGCASGCNNGAKLPITLTITCGSGDFDSGTCVSESWILAGSAQDLKGGVCGIGTATYGTHVNYNNTVAGGLIYSICNLDIEHLGLALASAKTQLYAAFPPGSGGSASSFVRWNNLMGEPSLLLWTDTPVVTNVTFPATVNVGTRRVRPQVMDQANQPIRDALVVMLKDSETVAQALTDEFGFADVPVTVNTPGTMTLTVTKRNHKPYLADITCVPAGQMVTYCSHTIDDDNAGGTTGNANATLNPGETVDLPIRIRNFGSSITATNISAVLTCSNPAISIIRGFHYYPNLAPGDSALSDTAFRISIGPSVQQNTRAILTLMVTSGVEITHSSIPIVCKAGDCFYENQSISGGDGDAVLEPNETANLRITIRNRGELAMESVTAHLRSISPFINVITNTGTINNIGVNDVAVTPAPGFQVRANQHTYPGHMAAMLLTLTTDGGFTDSVQFSVPVGSRTTTDPTGPDAYGYFAYENIDVGYDIARPYNYFDIRSLGTNLNLNDVGEQPPTAATYSICRNLPFPFRFYGEDYTQITVCSNGWAAFGDQDDLDPFRNYPIPGQQAPDAMIAPFWDDLRTQGTGLGVWDYFQADSHRYVIQWRAQGAFQSSSQDFEIILLDPAHHPTRDGNGIVIVQYASVSEMQGDYNDVPYSTIGIQAPGGLVGLQYRFNNTASPGAGALVAQRSIVFTTESHAAFGSVTGVVMDAENGQPMANAIVSVDGANESDTTDASGHYMLADVLAGTYTIRASFHGYNDGEVANTVVEMDSTELVNFSLTHPEIDLSVDEIDVRVPDQPSTVYFDMINDGNGPLNYDISIRYSAGRNLDERWDYLTGIDVSGTSGNQLIKGCEFAGDEWWVSGGGISGSQKYFYKYDLDGNFVGSVPQPTTNSLGWYDMAFDGEYLYGSTGNVIESVDLNGTPHETIPSPMNPTRAIAYDPATDHFWVTDFAQDIYEIDRTGALITRLPNSGWIAGLAWNPQDIDGYKLYAFEIDKTTNTHSRLVRIHPVSGHQNFTIMLDRQNGDRAGGCAITSRWNCTMLVFAGILENTIGDRLGIWELDFSTAWISVTPMFGSVPGNTTREMEIAFNPSMLRDGDYHVNLIIHNNSAMETVTLPVTLDVALPADEPISVPTVYRLDQNYPNPFNGQTTFRYELRQPGFTTLKLYNLLGQEVAAVVNEIQDKGLHTIHYNMNDLPSGVYIYRLQSGSFSEARKMMLLR